MSVLNCHARRGAQIGEKMKETIRKIKRFEIRLAVFICTLLACSPVNMVYATGTPNTQDAAADKWDQVIGFITPWIQRLGGVVILIGAVEFGLAFKNDDAEAKTKGMRTAIAGCIVFAVGLSSDIFLV